MHKKICLRIIAETPIESQTVHGATQLIEIGVGNIAMFLYANVQYHCIL